MRSPSVPLGAPSVDVESLLPWLLIVLTALVGVALLVAAGRPFRRVYRLVSAPDIDAVRSRDEPDFVAFAGVAREATDGTPPSTETPTPTEEPTEEPPTGEPTATPDDGQPGFGLVLALVALAAAGSLLRRRG